MLNVSYNFGQHIKCFMCQLEDDKENHLLECIIIKMSNPKIIENSEATFEDVFSTDMAKVSKISRLLIQSMRTRDIFRNQLV